MKRFFFNVVCILIAILSGISLFVLKYHVKDMEQELAQMHRNILLHKSAIHMLEAEWAYLNDPARLLMLVETQTDWSNISSTQLVNVTDIPFRLQETQNGQLDDFQIKKGE